MADPPIFKVVNGKRVPNDYKPAKGEVVKYRFVVDVGEDPITRKRKQKTCTFDRLRGPDGAEKALADILDRVNKGSMAAPSKLTVDDLLDRWLKSATRGKEKNTYSAYSNALKPARRYFGKEEAQKITSQHGENLLDWMMEAGRTRGGKAGTPLGSRSVQLTLDKLRAAWRWAVKQKPKLVEWNVFESVECPPLKKTKRVPWDQAEIRKFMGSLEGTRHEAPALLALLGVGPAELCGLRWDEDIDFKDDEVQAGENTRTLNWDEDGGHVIEKGGKNEHRGRKLPAPPQVMKALRALKAVQAKERLAKGKEYEHTGYVLVDEFGHPFRVDQWRRLLYKLMELAGVRKVRPYDARHACLTWLRMSGVPGPIVSAWAGHSDLTTADRNYVHPVAKDLVQGRDKLTELFG